MAQHSPLLFLLHHCQPPLRNHFPPPPTLPPIDLWADCVPTTVLIQSDQHLPLPQIDHGTRLPIPATWLHSLFHQLYPRHLDLLEQAPPHYLAVFPCLSELSSFSQLNAFPHGHCYDPHISTKPTSITLYLIRGEKGGSECIKTRRERGRESRKRSEGGIQRLQKRGGGAAITEKIHGAHE